jgi:hypothetical protein
MISEARAELQSGTEHPAQAGKTDDQRPQHLLSRKTSRNCFDILSRLFYGSDDLPFNE